MGQQRLRMAVVSIHAPARGATSEHTPSLIYVTFQSTPPRGGRLTTTEIIIAVAAFQSTPPRGGRLDAAGRLQEAIGFNPRPREGGDALSIPVCLSTAVSIHAPARGATYATCPPVLHLQFQSTPPRGGRQMTDNAFPANLAFQSTPPRGGRHADLPWSVLACSCFNPRPREGGDVRRVCSNGGKDVSIHAPARGATFACRQSRDRDAVSIHAPARGATPQPSRCLSSPRFQSTPPRGGRPRWISHSARHRCFNPRPREGGDDPA